MGDGVYVCFHYPPKLGDRLQVENLFVSINRGATNLPTRLFRQWNDSYLRLRLTSNTDLPGEGERSISVAIPFYNNAKMAHLALFNILGDPRVGEIVFLDDGSDQRQFEKLKSRLSPFSDKIKLFRREQNLGALANKLQAVELCRSEWVILLDYDNTVTTDYLDALYDLECWDADRIYCPAFAYPDYDFRDRYGGQLIDLMTAASLLETKTFYGPFFNDGNYFVNRARFVKTLKPFRNYAVSASDVLFANYLWLSSGGLLEVLADSWYIHRVHGKSAWLTHQASSTNAFRTITELIRNTVPADIETLDAKLERIQQQWEKPSLVTLSKSR